MSTKPRFHAHKIIQVNVYMQCQIDYLRWWSAAQALLFRLSRVQFLLQLHFVLLQTADHLDEFECLDGIPPTD